MALVFQEKKFYHQSLGEKILTQNQITQTPPLKRKNGWPLIVYSSIDLNYFLRSICKIKTSVYILKPCQEKGQVYEEVSLLRTQKYFE